MSAIFISHSSKDNQLAAEMVAWLGERGHRSWFLDFDPDAGIEAGSRWTQTLYDRLRQCQVVLALISEDWLASKWCFAELVYARSQGKRVVPVKVRPCAQNAIVDDLHQVDLVDDPDGHRKLEIALEEVFPWDGTRVPYPGLTVFEEADAAIYFGRGPEIDEGVETLESLRRQDRDAARFVLFLGASGSGKSSLVRAGIIPRLKQYPQDWLPVTPFRPGDHPFDGLADALERTFTAVGGSLSFDAIRARLTAAAATDPPDGKALLDLVRELQTAAGARDATVLLAIDQAEELLGRGDGSDADRFLVLLRAALASSDRQLMALATLRSDLLAAYQRHPFLLDRRFDQPFAYAKVIVDPLPAERFREIIRGPAERALITLDDRLVDRMVHDTGTPDALPLLAFTLRRLWAGQQSRRPPDGDGAAAKARFDLDSYERLGGLEGAIARAADDALDAGNRSAAELAGVRGGFVPGMVRVNADGDAVRRAAPLADLAPGATSLLRRFVHQRLLITDADQQGRETLEIAHDALLRVWPQLRDWLQDDQDKLRLFDSLERAATDWDRQDRTGSLLVHREGRLRDARDLVADDRFALPAGSVAAAYLDACIERDEAKRRAEQERHAAELRAQRKIARRNLAVALASVVALAAVTIGGYVGLRTTLNLQRAQSESLAKSAEQALANGQVQLAVELAMRALPMANVCDSGRPDTERAGEVLAHAAFRWHEPVLRIADAHAAPIDSIEFAPGGDLIVTASQDGTARVWDTEILELIATYSEHKAAVRTAQFSPDGELILTASADGTARIWDWSAGKTHGTYARERDDDYVNSARFNAVGSQIVATLKDGAVGIWDIEGDAPRREIATDARFVVWAEFKPDDDTTILASANTSVSEGVVEFWNDGDLRARLEPGAWTSAASYSLDGTRVVTAQGDRSEVWDHAGATLLAVFHHPQRVNSASFHPKTADTVVTASRDGIARVWKVESPEQPYAELRPATANEVRVARFSPDGQQVATVDAGGTLTLWPTRSPEVFQELLDFARTVVPEEVAAELHPAGSRLMCWLNTIAD